MGHRKDKQRSYQICLICRQAQIGIVAAWSSASLDDHARLERILRVLKNDSSALNEAWDKDGYSETLLDTPVLREFLKAYAVEGSDRYSYQDNKLTLNGIMAEEGELSFVRGTGRAAKNISGTDKRLLQANGDVPTDAFQGIAINQAVRDIYSFSSQEWSRAIWGALESIGWIKGGLVTQSFIDAMTGKLDEKALAQKKQELNAEIKNQLKAVIKKSNPDDGTQEEPSTALNNALEQVDKLVNILSGADHERITLTLKTVQNARALNRLYLRSNSEQTLLKMCSEHPALMKFYLNINMQRKKEELLGLYAATTNDSAKINAFKTKIAYGQPDEDFLYLDAQLAQWKLNNDAVEKEVQIREVIDKYLVYINSIDKLLKSGLTIRIDDREIPLADLLPSYVYRQLVNAQLQVIELYKKLKDSPDLRTKLKVGSVDKTGIWNGFEALFKDGGKFKSSQVILAEKRRVQSDLMRILLDNNNVSKIDSDPSVWEKVIVNKIFFLEMLKEGKLDEFLEDSMKDIPEEDKGYLKSAIKEVIRDFLNLCGGEVKKLLLREYNWIGGDYLSKSFKAKDLSKAGHIADLNRAETAYRKSIEMRAEIDKAVRSVIPKDKYTKHGAVELFFYDKQQQQHFSIEVRIDPESEAWVKLQTDKPLTAKDLGLPADGSAVLRWRDPDDLNRITREEGAVLRRYESKKGKVNWVLGETPVIVDFHLAEAYLGLAEVARQKYNFVESVKCFQKARDLYKKVTAKGIGYFERGDKSLFYMARVHLADAYKGLSGVALAQKSYGMAHGPIITPARRAINIYHEVLGELEEPKGTQSRSFKQNIEVTGDTREADRLDLRVILKQEKRDLILQAEVGRLESEGLILAADECGIDRQKWARISNGFQSVIDVVNHPKGKAAADAEIKRLFGSFTAAAFKDKPENLRMRLAGRELDEYNLRLNEISNYLSTGYYQEAERAAASLFGDIKRKIDSWKQNKNAQSNSFLNYAHLRHRFILIAKRAQLSRVNALRMQDRFDEALNILNSKSIAGEAERLSSAKNKGSLFIEEDAFMIEYRQASGEMLLAMDKYEDAAEMFKDAKQYYRENFTKYLAELGAEGINKLVLNKAIDPLELNEVHLLIRAECWEAADDKVNALINRYRKTGGNLFRENMYTGAMVAKLNLIQNQLEYSPDSGLGAYQQKTELIKKAIRLKAELDKHIRSFDNEEACFIYNILENVKYQAQTAFLGIMNNVALTYLGTNLLQEFKDEAE
ncbi:hypothetical protein ACFL4D_03320, partial [Candidatus Margulisiibacteriota bacterium]